MTTFTWITNSGAFSTATNWNPSGPPLAADTAQFGSSTTAGSGTITGSGTVATLQLNSTSGPWTWTAGTITANNFNVNDTNTLSTGAVWTLAGTPANNNYIVIGSGSAGSGNVTVTNGASIVSTQPGNTNAYGLYVASGTFANATGVLTVTGAGSSVNTGPNGAAVGETGTGTLDIEAGASATFASPNSSAISALAVSRAGAGTVKVSGTGSTLTANGYVYIGRQGNGSLLVDLGGTFTGGAAASGSTSSYAISIGDGTSLLDGNGNPVTTAYFGGNSTAQVLNGSTLHSLGNINVGNNGSTGTLTVDGASSVARADGSVVIGNGTARQGAKGTLIVQNGGTVRSGTVANASAGIVLGSQAGTTGTATVTGANSLLTAGTYRLTVGSLGTGTLTISNGAHALSGSSGYTDTEAALAVASSSAGGGGMLTITGAGSLLTASGLAVIGGNDTGGGITAGGAGKVAVTSGGTLQTGAMTIERGSIVSVDQTSTLTTPSITINGGTASLASLTTATSVSFGTGGTLGLTTVTGANTVGNFSFGDVIDVAGSTAVTLSGTTLTTSTGSISVGAAPSGANLQLISDGNGGTELTLTPQTIGVYRFFEQTNGTHFYTSSQTEAAGLANPSSSSYRADLTQETNGFGAYTQVASDPNEVQVYRFFDTVHGTEFLTASSTEASGLMTPGSSTYRSDLTYEASSSFYEDGSQQAGDVPVYRFFDTTYGTHFYTGNQAEYTAITTPGASGYRGDLTYEGVGFYAPAGTYST